MSGNTSAKVRRDPPWPLRIPDLPRRREEAKRLADIKGVKAHALLVGYVVGGLAEDARRLDDFHRSMIRAGIDPRPLLERARLASQKSTDDFFTCLDRERDEALRQHVIATSPPSTYPFEGSPESTDSAAENSR